MLAGLRLLMTYPRLLLVADPDADYYEDLRAFCEQYSVPFFG